VGSEAPHWQPEAEFLPVRDEVRPAKYKPWSLKKFADKGGALTDAEREKVQRYLRRQELRRIRDHEQQKLNVIQYAPRITQLEAEGKSLVEQGADVGVSHTTIVKWKAAYPEIFDAAATSMAHRMRAAANLMVATRHIETIQKLAQEAPNSVNTLVELRDTSEQDKVRHDSAKTILTEFNKFVQHAAQAQPFSPERRSVLRAVVERHLLPGEQVEAAGEGSGEGPQGDGAIEGEAVQISDAEVFEEDFVETTEGLER